MAQRVGRRVRDDHGDGPTEHQRGAQVALQVQSPVPPRALGHRSGAARAGGPHRAANAVDHFGALVAVGVGGTGTDVADRRWHRLVPMTTTDLDELLDELPLHGSIAARLVDRGRLAVVIARVARLAELLPQIVEMDINPVVCTPDACRLVDARIRIAPVAGPAGPRETDQRPIRDLGDPSG